MKRIIYKFTIFLLTFLFLLPLVGCVDFEEYFYDIFGGSPIDNWVKQEIEIYCERDVFFTFEESTTLKPSVCQKYINKYGHYNPVALEFVVDKPLEIDTSTPGTYTFTFTIQKHKADNFAEYETIVLTHDIYVVDFELKDGLYYSDNYDGTMALEFKLDSGVAYKFNYDTLDFDDIAYTINRTHMLEDGGYFCTDEDGNDHELFSIQFENENIEEPIYLDFYVKEGIINFSYHYRSDVDDCIKIKTLDNTYFYRLALIKKDNHITQEQIDAYKKYGTLYLDSNKTIEVTPETEIVGNELYIYYDQQDYSDCPFIGKYYYKGELIFILEGIGLKYSEEDSDYYFNYSAKNTDNGWVIETLLGTYTYNRFWGTLVCEIDGESYSLKKR